jgi:hypothetical protein
MSLTTAPSHPGRPHRRVRTVALVVATFLLAAGGAAGLARTGSAEASARSHTRLDVRWGDTTPVAGAKVLVYGFAFPGHSGRLLRVQTPAAGGTWRTVGSVRTLSNGSFTVYLQHTVSGSHRYRVWAPATATATSAASRTVTFQVHRRATTLTATLPATTVARRSPAVLRGTVGPDFTARTVTVQGRATGALAWTTVGRVALNAGRQYSVPLPTASAGTREYRATVPATRYAAAATSAVVALRVTG